MDGAASWQGKGWVLRVGDGKSNQELTPGLHGAGAKQGP